VVQRFDLDGYIASLQPGLDRAVLRALQHQVGRDLAISRVELVTKVRRLGFDVHERGVRAMINELRKDGHLICSTGGKGGGYWLAKDWRELREFLDSEVHPRAMDLLQTEKAMKQAAQMRWGREQMRLF
jgi:hypothetical protein